MTGGEQQPQDIVAELIVNRAVVIRHLLLTFMLVSEFLVLPLQELFPAQVIDGAMLRDRRKPRTWAIGDARRRPFLKRNDERVLRKLFGQAEVTDNPSDAGDDSG